MANERWNSPFPHTIAFVLFKEHFTELNYVYWAHVPAASTIEKKALEALKSEDADPKRYFLIPDKDDRRISKTYAQWKSFYREFSNYTRLNMLMLLSSCFETYLRTIVSLSLESKPGIIIKAPDAVDGWFLFRKNSNYGNYGSKDYQFLEEIGSVCQGDWNSRANAYIKYFGNMPLSATEISELDDLRQKRNLVGHYFGREKQKYEAPLFFEPSPVQRISHDKLIKYFNVVYEAVEKIDRHLHQNYIGSYDVMKFFYIHNPHLSYGFLTGILRVAKESIFSGLNNLKINSILDERYSEYFGFTSSEVHEMADYYHASDKYQELCEWYDGYLFGNTEIFNPWSVIGYFNNNCRPKAFWQSTGSNDIIREVLASATPDIMERLELLMKGESFVTHIDTGVIYPQIQNDPSSVYSFLLVAGYLKAVSCDQSYGEDYMCEVALPNKEISFVYSKEILSQLENIIPRSVAVAIQEAIYKVDSDSLQKTLEKFLLQTISFHDAANETFYHGLILGMCAVMDNSYRITSNREAGDGRFDIQMLPLNKRLPGILIELKAGKDRSETQLEDLANVALQQINDRAYSVDLQAMNVTSIIKIGIAFSGKRTRIAAERQNIE